MDNLEGFKMKRDYNKTQRVLWLIRELISSPNKMIDDEKFQEIMGNPGRQNYFNLINELTEPYGKLPALLTRNKKTKTYTLNESYSGLEAATTHSEFVLECYSRLGSILPEGMQKKLSVITEKKANKKESLKRKFCQVKPIEGKELKPAQKKILEGVIEAILNQNEIVINYQHADSKVDDYIMKPYTLCLYRDDLYLFGERNIGGLKYKKTMCKIRRIKSLKLLTGVKTFNYPTSWNPHGEYQNTSGIINNEEEACDVLIKVYGVSRLAFQEKKFFNNILLNENSGEDFDLYRMKCTRYFEFIGQLFVYAQDVEIVDVGYVDPKVQQKIKKLKKMFVEKAQEALKRNQESQKKRVA